MERSFHSPEPTALSKMFSYSHPADLLTSGWGGSLPRTHSAPSPPTLKPSAPAAASWHRTAGPRLPLGLQSVASPPINPHPLKSDQTSAAPLMGGAPSTSRPLHGPFPPLRIWFLSFLPWGAFPYFSGLQPKCLSQRQPLSYAGAPLITLSSDTGPLAAGSPSRVRHWLGPPHSPRAQHITGAE